MSGAWMVLLAVSPSNDERVQALHIGASVLRSRWPNVQVDCEITLGPNVRTVSVAFEWPGVVRVTTRNTGQLIAQSLPGQPFELDPRAHA